jgi:hypothetical protein
MPWPRRLRQCAEVLLTPAAPASISAATLAALQPDHLYLSFVVYIVVLLHELMHILAAGGCKHLIGVSLFPPAVILDKCNDRVAKAPALIGLPALPFLVVEETQPLVALFALNLISLLETCGPHVEHRGKGLLTKAFTRERPASRKQLTIGRDFTSPAEARAP